MRYIYATPFPKIVFVPVWTHADAHGRTRTHAHVPVLPKPPAPREVGRMSSMPSASSQTGV